MTQFRVEVEGAHATVEFVDSSGDLRTERVKPGRGASDGVVVDGPPRVTSDGPVSVWVEVLEEADDA